MRAVAAIIGAIAAAGAGVAVGSQFGDAVLIGGGGALLLGVVHCCVLLPALLLAGRPAPLMVGALVLSASFPIWGIPSAAIAHAAVGWALGDSREWIAHLCMALMPSVVWGFALGTLFRRRRALALTCAVATASVWLASLGEMLGVEFFRTLVCAWHVQMAGVVLYLGFIARPMPPPPQLVRRWPPWRCACGYDLRGLPEPVCPECGRSFRVAEAEQR